MVNRLRRYGREETVQAGTALFRRGERDAELFVVLTGKIEVIAENLEEAGTVIAEIKEMQFTGELNLLTSNPALSDGVAACESTILRVSRTDLRRLMRAEADIANMVMQAAIWRRVAMLSGGPSGVTLLGKRDSADTVLLLRFLGLNRYPHRFVDLSETASSLNTLQDGLGVSLPAVVYPDGKTVHISSVTALADELGIGFLPDCDMKYDLIVAGAGPAGLSAAVYAASEGLSVLVLEALASGGQAGWSSKIENYLGFPTGVSGFELAGRAEAQALKFGAGFAIPQQAIGIERAEACWLVRLSDTTCVYARALVIATGARYRRLDIADYERFENRGIYYAATGLEAQLCRQRPVVVVGGGNSAGQAAVFLSSFCAQVHLVLRRESLASTMSQYLISRIENAANIFLHACSEVVALKGHESLEEASWEHSHTRERQTLAIGGLFVMIGAGPNTEWLRGSLDLDEKRFIRTGQHATPINSRFGTSSAGVFAVGDVRSGSLKRVASAVGEGSVAISEVQEYLALTS